MTEYIGSRKDVIPAILHLEVIREDLRSSLQTNHHNPEQRAKIIAETRAIKKRQVVIANQLWFDQTGDDSRYMP